MYNMRYHLASLVAVFLALTIGLLLGGTIAGRAPENIHDTLIEGIQRDVDIQRERNDELRAENIIIRDFSDMLMDDFVADRLLGKTILVFGTDAQDIQRVTVAFADTGAELVQISPNFDHEADAWTFGGDFDLEALDFHGIVNIFEPAGIEGEYLSDYFEFLQQTQENYEVPLIFAAIDTYEEDNFIVYAWDAGFSGTNQLGNHYGTYTMVVLLGSNTEGMFGSTEGALALYPPTPSQWTIAADAANDAENVAE